MRTFADKLGRQWSIDLTFGDIKRIRQRMGVDLMGLSDKDDEGKTLLHRIRDDLETALNLVYVAIEPEAQRLRVSDEEFGQSLDGDSAAGALAALWGAVADFFQGLRPIVSAEAEKVMAMRRMVAAILGSMTEAQQIACGVSPTEQAEPAACPSTG